MSIEKLYSLYGNTISKRCKVGFNALYTLLALVRIIKKQNYEI